MISRAFQSTIKAYHLVGSTSMFLIQLLLARRCSGGNSGLNTASLFELRAQPLKTLVDTLPSLQTRRNYMLKREAVSIQSSPTRNILLLPPRRSSWHSVVHTQG